MIDESDEGGERDRTDPDHPIVDRPWEYDIVEFSYNAKSLNDRHHYIDLTLRRGPVDESLLRYFWRELRFLGPRDLRIEGDFPASSGGLRILDVRGRQLDGLGVWVVDSEQGHGSVTFWAREVIDLGAIKPRYKRGDRVVLAGERTDWIAGGKATITRRGQLRNIFDGTPHIEYVVEFDEPMLDPTDGDHYSGSNAIERDLLPWIEEVDTSGSSTSPAE